MIVGDGLIASQCEDDPNVVIFASGVSNSKCKDQAQFDCEAQLLLRVSEQSAGKRLVYFSTCSVFGTHTPYTQHKLAMEQLVRKTYQDHLIVRLPIVIGESDNPHTLTNYLHACIRDRKRFTLQRRAYRYVIDAADIPTAVQRLAGVRGTVAVAHPSVYSVAEIVSELEDIVGQRAVYDISDTGDAYSCDPVYIATEGRGYLRRTLRKYYRDRRIPARAPRPEDRSLDAAVRQAAHAWR